MGVINPTPFNCVELIRLSLSQGIDVWESLLPLFSSTPLSSEPDDIAS